MRTIVSRVTSSALLAALLSTGCMIEDEGPLDDEANLDEDEGVEILPAPTRWNAERPVLDAAAAHRQREVDRYVRDVVYAGYDILQTTQTDSGDLIDWVDPRSVPGSEITPPPPIDPDELALPPGIELQPTELDGRADLRGPAGSIPFVRPSMAGYVRDGGAASLGEFMAGEQVAQAAFGSRRYAGYQVGNGVIGLDAYVSQQINQIEPGSFSLLEVAVSCQGSSPNTTRELVGATVSKDMANFNDATQRLRVEFLTQGDAAGNFIGGWDGKYMGFVSAAGRPYGPNVALLEGNQYESRFHIQNYSGNWWISHNGNWLGYYQGWMFDLMPFQACTANYYGEVYDPTPSTWTWTDMGTGYYPSAGSSLAAHVRNPTYILPNGQAFYLTNAAQVFGPVYPACYDQSPVYNQAAPWNSYFLLGGSGYNIFTCN